MQKNNTYYFIKPQNYLFLVNVFVGVYLGCAWLFPKEKTPDPQITYKYLDIGDCEPYRTMCIYDKAFELTCPKDDLLCILNSDLGRK